LNADKTIKTDSSLSNNQRLDRSSGPARCSELLHKIYILLLYKIKKSKTFHKSSWFKYFEKKNNSSAALSVFFDGTFKCTDLVFYTFQENQTEIWTFCWKSKPEHFKIKKAIFRYLFVYTKIARRSVRDNRFCHKVSLLVTGFVFVSAPKRSAKRNIIVRTLRASVVISYTVDRWNRNPRFSCSPSPGFE